MPQWVPWKQNDFEMVFRSFNWFNWVCIPENSAFKWMATWLEWPVGGCLGWVQFSLFRGIRFELSHLIWSIYSQFGRQTSWKIIAQHTHKKFSIYIRTGINPWMCVLASREKHSKCSITVSKWFSKYKYDAKMPNTADPKAFHTTQNSHSRENFKRSSVSNTLLTKYLVIL